MELLNSVKYLPIYQSKIQEICNQLWRMITKASTRTNYNEISHFLCELLDLSMSCNLDCLTDVVQLSMLVELPEVKRKIIGTAVKLIHNQAITAQAKELLIPTLVSNLNLRTVDDFQMLKSIPPNADLLKLLPYLSRKPGLNRFCEEIQKERTTKHYVEMVSGNLVNHKCYVRKSSDKWASSTPKRPKLETSDSDMLMDILKQLEDLKAKSRKTPLSSSSRTMLGKISYTIKHFDSYSVFVFNILDF